MDGWKCPGCGKCYSPCVFECGQCGQPSQDVLSTEWPIKDSAEWPDHVCIEDPLKTSAIPMCKFCGKIIPHSDDIVATFSMLQRWPG